MLRLFLLLPLAMPALGGCSGAIAIDVAVRAIVAPREAAADAQETARRHFAEGRFGDAAWHYRKALAQERNSVAVLNGLAASYDRLGRFDLSERFYHEALSLDPQSAQTLNNLGYSYLLQGKPDVALAFLGRAPADPGDAAVIAGNRDLAEAALDGSAAVAAPATTASPPTALAPIVTAAVDARPLAGAVRRAWGPGIEIANGAGRGGMAARVGAYLRGKGVAVARLANARPFDKEVTTIFYGDGARADAEAVATLLPAPVRLESGNMHGAPVRIELGRDLIAFDNKKNTTRMGESNDAAKRASSK